MGTVQSTYPDTITNAYAGAIANQEPKTLISRTVEDSGGIAFGLAVMQGTADKGCVVSDGDAFLGVVVRTQSVEDGSFEGVAYRDEARIMTKGVVWVTVSGAVNAGDGVEVQADGALAAFGSGTEVVGARWDTSATNGNLAQLRLA